MSEGRETKGEGGMGRGRGRGRRKGRGRGDLREKAVARQGGTQGGRQDGCVMWAAGVRV